MSSPAQNQTPEDTAQPTAPASLWAPLQNHNFRLLYSALFITNVGGWMNGIGCSWLMTSLDGSAFMLGLVQASFMLPGILFSLPGGVLADKLDRRRYIIILSTITGLVSLDLSLLTWMGWIGPWSLLAHTLAMGTVFALQGPALLSVIQDMVKRDLLAQALTLNSIALNVGRSVGPMIAGALISSFGAASAFLVNAFGYTALGGFFWRQPKSEMRQQNRETFSEALWNGLRFAVTERRFRGMLIRLTLFLSCASSLLSLMPLVAKVQLDGGPGTFGTLVTWVGIGSVVAAFGRGRLTSRVTPDIHVHLSVIGATLSYIGMAFTDDLYVACALTFLYGLAWTNASITFQVATQLSLPSTMRGRGVSLFMMTFGLGMMIGGLFWGLVSDLSGLKFSLIGAGIGTMVFNVLTWRLTLNATSQIEDPDTPLT